MCTAPGGENSRQTRGSERHCRKGIVVGQRCQYEIAIGKIVECRGSASAGYHRGPLRVPVLDEHLITVVDQVDRKSGPHMAKADYADSWVAARMSVVEVLTMLRPSALRRRA
jgi:hypothetical protein